MITEITVRTSGRTVFEDITSKVSNVIQKSGITDGVCYVYVPHTTAAVTINENADPSVSRDILYEMNKIIPFSDNYHHMEGNSAAHIKSSLFGASEMIFVEGGKLVLGTWQNIWFVDFDGPRERTVKIKVIEG